MINALDKGFISFLSKNRTTFYVFIVLALMTANIYQYMDKKGIEDQCRQEVKRLNDINLKIATETLQYERQRSERLEFLLNSLSKTGK